MGTGSRSVMLFFMFLLFYSYLDQRNYHNSYFSKRQSRAVVYIVTCYSSS